jgi:hypothetical protein
MTCTCCQPLSEAQRIAYPASVFGVAFPFAVEPAIFTFAQDLSSDYTGGYWDFYALSNGGFYMAPDSGSLFVVRAENGFEGQLSACALGITACLYAYSHLSFGNGDVAAICAEQYSLLREHALDHREAAAILAAID